MFSFKIGPGALVLLSVLLPVVLADNLFAGCYTSLPSNSNPPSTGSVLRSSSLDCSAGCTANTHSYYNASSRQCFCSNGTPFQTSLVLGNENACGTAYDNRNIRTSYMSLNPQCYATAPTGITAANTQMFTGLNGCLNSCKNGLRATYWANTAGNNYYCSCVVPTRYGAGATCGPQAYFGYYHTPEAAASGLTRRKEREVAASKAAARLSFCPNGWTACSVGDEEDDSSYECIDVSKELDSCGGCMNGQFYAPNATVGQDCSSMAGAARGGSTCYEGKCLAFACQRGYILRNGQCVRSVR